MERLIIPLIIFIVISQVIKAIKKASEQARKEAQDKPMVDPTIEMDIDFLEDIEAEKVQENEPQDDRPRLIMESKPEASNLEINIHDEESFKEDSPYKMDIGLPKESSKPQKAKSKQKKSPLISFAPKSIAQGIVISEILKRPKY